MSDKTVKRYHLKDEGQDLTHEERDLLIAAVDSIEPESYDAMLRCRMTKSQLHDELPRLAASAGYNDTSKYVRARLFGGTPEARLDRRRGNPRK